MSEMQFKIDLLIAFKNHLLKTKKRNLKKQEIQDTFVKKN